MAGLHARSGRVSLVDRAGSAASRLDRRRLRIFPDGWGEPAAVELLGAEPEPVSSVEVVWARKEEHAGFRVRRGQFTSPAASLLPPEARVVRVELVEPGRGSRRLCLLLPAWNDHGFVQRRQLSVLLAARGIASVALEVPLYGARRTVPAPAQAIRTVGHLGLMGYGAVLEARALLASMAEEFAQLGVSGFSMGGNLAALLSAASPRPLATAPLAASHSPGPVYLDGAMRNSVAWRALGGRGQAEPRLRALLSSVTALSRLPLPHHRAAVLVAAERDGYVPPSATRALAAHWEGSELRWVRAGHATLLLRRREVLAAAIGDAFDRLEQLSLHESP